MENLRTDLATARSQLRDEQRTKVVLQTKSLRASLPVTSAASIPAVVGHLRVRGHFSGSGGAAGAGPVLHCPYY